MVYPQPRPHPVTQAQARGETRPQVETAISALTRSFAGHAAVDALEVGEVREVDRDPPALGAHLNVHARVEVSGQQLLELEQPRRTQACRRRQAGAVMGRRRARGSWS